MSTTLRDLIQRAYEAVEVARVGAAVSGEKSDYALYIAQEILDRWESESVSHGLGDVNLNTVIYNGSLRSALRKNLAVELVEKGPYGGSISPLLAGEARSEYLRLQPHRLSLKYDSALTTSESFRIDRGYE